MLFVLLLDIGQTVCIWVLGSYCTYDSLGVLKLLLNPFEMLLSGSVVLRTFRFKPVIGVPTQNHCVNHQNRDGSVAVGNLEVQLVVEVGVDPAKH